ncbi:MAG: hypothetical protein ACO1TE_00800 [Prosthecobacter sp.]
MRADSSSFHSSAKDGAPGTRPQVGGWLSTGDGSPLAPPPRSRLRWVNAVLWRAGTALFLGLGIVNMYGVLAIDMPYNAPYHWVGRWLAAPLLLGGWLYGWTQRRYFIGHRQVSRGRFFFCALVVPPMLLLFSGGPVSLVNAAFPTGETVRYEGPVTQLKVTGGRHKGHVVTLWDEKSQAEVRLETDMGTYGGLLASQREGHTPRFRRDMRIGLLGIPFRWR